MRPDARQPLRRERLRMTKQLDAETKRLRGLTAGQLADEVGRRKAEIAELGERIDELKQEAVRRGLTSAEGDLFRIALSPPGQQQRLDREVLGTVFGEAFLAHFSRQVETDWSMRCYARRAASDKAAA
jgi:hypothetical protein